ncbi:MAG: bifunctional diaminohydroxyphosphoribosylaminopyrimidine deaminase/5-amino-6-(5-phosphoribosylamino)uracil reductase RibD [Paraprevotella sp.]|nr:bifunctional diaminohydroxyphosphoribosylaminopyrimidine deaminase/5-amino-6-(5-phosphoribosylamino)uracil reductase RibD [Paraprevotella sp.]
MEIEEKYMRRCIQLAQNGRLNTTPNPMVGAVIVHDGRIIGEGYHVCCGQAHAEVNAIASVKEPALLRNSTLYVSLEPCSHYGKTPPCADLIIEKGIPRVVVGCIDPFASVAGRGIRKLQEAGVETVVGVCEQECLELNKIFFTYHQRRRPFVTLKWAESEDGFMDRLRSSAEKDGKPVVFSSLYTQMLVHKRRSEHQAIMVGRRTAELDNPRLDVRCWTGRSPLRILLDPRGVLPDSLYLFDGDGDTLVYLYEGVAAAYAGLQNVSCVYLPKNEYGLKKILSDLYEKGIQSLLVEGGAALLQSFIEEHCWDEAFVEQSSVLLSEGVSAPCVWDESMKDSFTWAGHVFRHYRRKDSGEV